MDIVDDFDSAPAASTAPRQALPSVQHRRPAILGRSTPQTNRGSYTDMQQFLMTDGGIYPSKQPHQQQPHSMKVEPVEEGIQSSSSASSNSYRLPVRTMPPNVRVSVRPPAPQPTVRQVLQARSTPGFSTPSSTAPKAARLPQVALASNAAAKKPSSSSGGAMCGLKAVLCSGADLTEVVRQLGILNRAVDDVIREQEEVAKKKQEAKKTREAEEQKQQLVSNFNFSQTQKEIEITLTNEEIWREFNAIGTEMFARECARRMFPRFELNIKGLDPEGMYSIVLCMKLVEPVRYIYSENRWVPLDQQTAASTWTNAVLHPDNSATGEQWMRAPVNFDAIKLTKKSPPENLEREISVMSLHKYLPVFQVVRLDLDQPTIVFNWEPKLCEFVAVSDYHNREVAALKVKHNPIARKLRDGAARKRLAEAEGDLTESMIDELSQSPLLYDDDHHSTADEGSSAKRPRMDVEDAEEPLGVEDEAATESIFIVDENAGEEKKAPKPDENEEEPSDPVPNEQVDEDHQTNEQTTQKGDAEELNEEEVAPATESPVESEPPQRMEGLDDGDLDDQDTNKEAFESGEPEGELAEDPHEEEIATSAEVPAESEAPSQNASDETEKAPGLSILESDPVDQDPNDETLEAGEVAEEFHEEENASATEVHAETEPSSENALEEAEEFPELSLLELEPVDHGPNEEAPHDDSNEEALGSGELDPEPEEEDGRSDSPSDAALAEEVSHEGDDAEEERHENVQDRSEAVLSEPVFEDHQTNERTTRENLSEELHEEEAAAATEATTDIEPPLETAPEDEEATLKEDGHGLDTDDWEPNEEALESGQPDGEDARRGSPSVAENEAGVEVPQEGEDGEDERHENVADPPGLSASDATSLDHDYGCQIGPTDVQFPQEERP